MAQQMTKAKKLSIDLMMMGPEPEPFVVESANDRRLTAALRWYGYFFDQEDAKKWLLAYVKDNYDRATLEAIRSAPTWRTSMTVGTLAKLIEMGTTLLPTNMEFLDAAVKENARFAKQQIQGDEQPAAPKVINPHERLRRKVVHLLNEVEHEIDQHVFEGVAFSLYDWAHKEQAPPAVIKTLQEKAQKLLDEHLAHPDEFKHRASQRATALYREMIADAERLLVNKQQVRATRTKVAPTTEKLVKDLKFKKDFAPLRLVSVDPQRIVGAKELWIYSTKYNELGVFVADSDMGLGLKGQSVINFDTVKSIVKKVRKPEDTLAAFFKSRPAKVLKDLTAKEHTISARLREDIVLLKAVM